MAESNVVLAGFAPIHIQKPVRQEHLLSYYAWLMASARCAAEGAATAEAAGEIMLAVQEKVRRYGVSPSFIARRQFNAFPDSEEALGQAGVPPQLPEGFEDLLNQPEGPSIAQRMERFEQIALQVFRKWYQPDATAPDDLIHDLKSGGASTEEIAKTLMATDLKRACDELLPVFEATGGTDGFVSVEVAPTLAGDTEASVAEARDWVKQIDRPNLLVKIPATPEGIPAIRRLLAEGISVNITLIFSLDRYGEVMEAYLGGLEEYHEAGGDVSKVASVASFFVSRFDTEVDKRLESIGTEEALALRGLTAIANARVAYGRFLEVFGGDRFKALEAKGARLQKPLDPHAT